MADQSQMEEDEEGQANKAPGECEDDADDEGGMKGGDDDDDDEVGNEDDEQPVQRVRPKNDDGGEGGEEDEGGDDDEETPTEAKRRKKKVKRAGDRDREGGGKKKTKKRKRRDMLKPSMLDDEAAESGEEGERGDDEEEGDDENEYVLDDFVVADDHLADEEDDDGASSGNERRRERPKKKRVKRAVVEELRQEVRNLGDTEEYEEEEPQRRERRRGLDEYDSDDSFIVEDDEEFGYRERGTEKRRRRHTTFQQIDQDQLDDLLAVFPEHEEEEEEGRGEEEDDEGRRVKVGEPGARPQTHLEPAVLREYFMTPEDERIRKEDVPERMQVRRVRTRVMDDIERTDEANWILDELGLSSFSNRSDQLDAVLKVLELLNNEKLEIPFIWTYRRDYVHPHLHRDHLWRIAELDERWEEIQRRKHLVLTNMDRLLSARGDVGDEEALRQAEQRLQECQKNIEVHKKRVQELQEKEERRRNNDDEDSEEEFDDTLPEAKQHLEEEERRHAEALVEVQRLEQAIQKAGSVKDPMFEGIEEFLAELCPDSYRTLLEGTHDEEVVRDVQEYLALIAGHHSGGRRTHRSASDTYRKCRRSADLRRVAHAFALPAPALGHALAHGQETTDSVRTPEAHPEDLAGDVADKVLPRADDVLRGLRHMLAMEVAFEPNVRRALRQSYRKGATLNSMPTMKGRAEMDEFHRYHGLQYLRGKHVYEYLQGNDRTEYLRLLSAEREGFLTFTISPPQRFGARDTDSVLVEMLESVYQPSPEPAPGMDRSVHNAWMRFRKEILNDAVKLFLLPLLEQECRRMLKKKASEAVVQEAANALRDIVNTGPYMPKSRNANCTYVPPYEDFGLRVGGRKVPADLVGYNGLEVVAIVLAPTREEPSFAVAVSRDGAVRDMVNLPPVRFGMDGDTDQRAKLEKLLLDQPPDVIVINAKVGYEAKRMQMRLEKLVEHVGTLLREHEAAEGDGQQQQQQPTWRCDVVLVDDSLARVYARSNRCKKEFVDQHENLRTAIALGRHMQDPLPLVTTIFSAQDPRGGRVAGPGYQLKFLQLHPLQDQVNPHGLLRRYEEVVVDAVNDVGVDLNRVASTLYLASLLPFVCGLGFRKANALRAAIRATCGTVTSRRQLLDDYLLTPKVYVNAAGFLRVRPRRDEDWDKEKGSKKRQKAREKERMGLLDNTRIHPECYDDNDWAHKICSDSIEHIEGETNPNELVTMVMQDSLNQLINTLVPTNYKALETLWDSERNELNDDLSRLDLEQYAAYLEQCGNGRRHLQLQQIKDELRFPYRDRRPPFRGHHEDVLFQLLTGETDATLRPGIRVTGTVINVTEVAARVRLDQMSVIGYVHRSRFPGVQRDQDFNEVLKVGTPIEGVITDVEKAKVSVRVSCASEDVERTYPRPDSLPRLDPSFLPERAEQDYRERRRKAEEKIRKARESAAGVVSKAKARRRVIDYPKFKVMAFKQAEEYLKGLQQIGEHIFRPGSNGGLSLSWLFYQDIVVHVPIEERNKGPGDAIGRTLRIKDKEYQELDQIVAQYITPMNDLVDSVINNRKFIKGSRDFAEQKLREEKRREPTKVVYGYFADFSRPGCFSFAHIVKTQLFREPVEVTPRGLVYRGLVFRNADQVSDHFKSHYKDAVPAHASRAAGTPSQPAQSQQQTRASRWQQPQQPFHHQSSGIVAAPRAATRWG